MLKHRKRDTWFRTLAVDFLIHFFRYQVSLSQHENVSGQVRRWLKLPKIPVLETLRNESVGLNRVYFEN